MVDNENLKLWYHSGKVKHDIRKLNYTKSCFIYQNIQDNLFI